MTVERSMNGTSRAQQNADRMSQRCGTALFCLTLCLAAQTVFAQTEHRGTGDASTATLETAIRRYAQNQRDGLAAEARPELERRVDFRFLRRRSPRDRDEQASTSVPSATSAWEANEDAPIFAASFPSLSWQDEPASHPAEKDEEEAAGGHTEDSLAEINNKLNNPGADLATLNFKFTWNQYEGNLPGSSSQDSVVLNFQPVFPFKLSDGGNFLVRATIPVLWQPGYNAGNRGFDEEFGLGDSQIVGFYSRTNMKKGYMWGAGAAMQFPTHTDNALGKDQFQLGPAAFVGLIGKWGSVGVFPQHLWNIGGSGDGYTASTVLQYWYWFGVGEGYQVGGSPIIVYDWAADNSDQAWTVPVNLGVSKTILVGNLPVKLRFEGIYYIVQPDAFGPHWGLQFTFSPVVNNPFEGLFGKKKEE